MIIVMLLLSLATWSTALVLFEAIYASLTPRLPTHLSKVKLARMCWGILLFTAILGTCRPLLHILGLVPLALSHIDLLMRHSDSHVLCLRSVFANVPTAVRQMIDKLKPFLRGP